MMFQSLCKGTVCHLCVGFSTEKPSASLEYSKCNGTMKFVDVIRKPSMINFKIYLCAHKKEGHIEKKIVIYWENFNKVIFEELKKNYTWMGE